MATQTRQLAVTRLAPQLEPQRAFGADVLGLRQFPLEQGMFPDFLLKELFGREYFIQVLPPRRVEIDLL